MAESPASVPVSTFVVRFWLDASARGARWRGHVTHVQSGGRTSFLDLDALAAFVRAYGVMISDKNQDVDKETGGA